MSEFSYGIDTGDYLFGIAQEQLTQHESLRAQLMGINGINNEQEAAGRYAMIIAAINNLDDMDYIYAGSQLSIPENDIAVGVMHATADVTRTPNNLRAVYDIVEPAYRSGGKERIQAAIRNLGPEELQQTAARDMEEVVTQAKATVNSEDSAQIINSATGYYAAISAYNHALAGMDPHSRNAAMALLKAPENLRTRVETQFPDNDALATAAAHVDTASTRLIDDLVCRDADGCTKLALGVPEITDRDARSIMANLRVSAGFDDTSTVDNALRATQFALTVAPARFNAGAIMEHADHSAMETLLTQSTTITPTTEEAQHIQTAEHQFRLSLQGNTNFSFTDLAKIPLHDAQYRAGRDDVNALGAPQTRDQISDLRDAVGDALQQNGVDRPSERQITQATAYILSVENGSERRDDTIEATQNIEIPSPDKVSASVAVFADAMGGIIGLSGTEQDQNYQEVEGILNAPATPANTTEQQTTTPTR